MAEAAASTSAQEQELYTELACEVYHELEQYVSDPAFCAALERPGRSGAKDGFLARWGSGWRKTQAQQHALQDEAPQASAMACRLGGGAAEAAAGADDAGSGAIDTANAGALAADGALPEGQDGYVLVDRRDAIEAMALYIAACIVDLPEAQNLTPKELQGALVETLKTLKRTRFQQAWSWGKCMYRWTTYTYSAVQMYQNPWLMRAVVTALFYASRYSLRLVL